MLSWALAVPTEGWVQAADHCCLAARSCNPAWVGYVNAKHLDGWDLQDMRQEGKLRLGCTAHG